MTASSCPDREVLRAFSRGDLSGASGEQITDHVSSCTSCSNWLGEQSAAAVVSPPGYELLEQIGRGGMGVVYRARDVRLDRHVAVKLLRKDVPAASVTAARFLIEAKITGQLQHPGIPAVHELGALPDGRPFLAMKLVKGRTLAELLQERSSPTHDRGTLIAIFEQICQAVGYAHSHEVIHRDLKPGNVMVGAFGQVQVMDWGLAKVLIDARAEEEAATVDLGDTLTRIHARAEAGSETQTGDMLGTPAYLAPEQAGGETRRLDARTDVFGLGAILCTILTGEPPYERQANRNAARLQAVRGETQRALARLDASGAEPDVVDLCKSCLSFDPQHRPADGGVVAQEVARIRQAAEERARQAELDRAQALVREEEMQKRRRVLTSSACALAVVLSLGMLGTTIGLVRANVAANAERLARREAVAKRRLAERSANAERLAKRQAERQRRVAQAASAAEKRAREQAEQRLGQIEKGLELFAGMLSGLNPRAEEQGAPPLYDQLRSRAVTVADELVGESVGDPLAVARLQTGLGRVLLELNEPAKAAELLELARATRETILPKDDPDTLTTLSNLASSYSASGRTREAIQLFVQVHGAMAANQGADHQNTLRNLNALAAAHLDEGNVTDAIKLFEEVRDARVKQLGINHADTLTVLNNLAVAYQRADRTLEAIELLENVRDGTLKTHGKDHVDAISALHNLASAHYAAGQLAEAQKLFEQVLDARVKKLGAADTATLIAMNNLAVVYAQSGRMQGAIDLYQQACETLAKTQGGDHPKTLIALSNLASAYRSSNDLPKSIALFEDVRNLWLKKGNPADRAYLTTLNNLAMTYQAAGRLPEAVAAYEEYLVIRQKTDPDSWMTFRSLSLLGSALAGQQKYVDAEPMLLKGYDGMKTHEAAMRSQAKPHLLEAVERLVDLYDAWGKPDQADLWRSRMAVEPPAPE